MDKEYAEHLKRKIRDDLYPKLGQELRFEVTIEGVTLEVHAPYVDLDGSGRLKPDAFEAQVTIPDDSRDLSPVLDSKILEHLLDKIPDHE